MPTCSLFQGKRFFSEHEKISKKISPQNQQSVNTASLFGCPLCFSEAKTFFLFFFFVVNFTFCLQIFLVFIKGGEILNIIAHRLSVSENCSRELYRYKLMKVKCF